MKILGCRDGIVTHLVLVSVLVTVFLIGSPRIFSIASADHREFEAEKYDENLTLSPNAIGAIDLDLQDGEEFEIVYTLQVKEKLPVDVWFVHEDHYLLLVNGAQFIFFIDGSEQEVTYTRKIVTITEPDPYKLVITNYYNNQTIQVNVVYEIRTYTEEVEEVEPDDSSIFLYPLLIIVVILAILLVILLLRAQKYKHALVKTSLKPTTKKVKQKSRKPKKAKKRVSKKAEPEEEQEPKETESEEPEKKAPGFCRYCGTPITTPYCKNCGRKV